MGLTEALFRMPSARVSWVAALFLLCYVGVEVALGGWIVIFMLRVRHGEPFASGMSAMGFWLGITVGRAILGFVTPRLGVKLSTAVRDITLLISSQESTNSSIAVHHCSRRSRTRLLACTAILCLRSGRRLPRLLPRPSVPERHPRR